MKNFKFFDVTDWTANNYNAHIAIISRSKDNQTITFGQSIEYNMINLFLEKAYTKCGGESILGFMDNCMLLGISLSLALRENYPNTEFFLVRIFLYSE